MSRIVSILLTLAILAPAQAQQPKPVFEQILKVGLIDSRVPTSLMPSPDALIEYCTQRLTTEKSKEAIARLYEIRATAQLAKSENLLAEADATQARNLLPTDLRVAYTYAKCIANAGKTEEAIQICNQLNAQHPAYAPAYTLRAFIATQVENDTDLGTSKATMAISIAPDWERPYLARAKARLKAEDYDGALSDITRYLELRSVGPESSEQVPFLLRGKCLFELKRYAEAATAFDTALRLAPKSYEAARGIWQCEQRLGNNDSAAIAAYAMFDIDPGHEHSAWAMGVTHFENENYTEAIPHLRKWHKLDPGSESRILLLAAAEFGAESYSNAKMLYDKASEDHSSKRASLARGIFLFTCPDSDINNKKQALLAVQDLACDDSMDVASFIIANLVQYGAGDRSTAIANIERRLKDNPPRSAKYVRALESLAESMGRNEPLKFSARTLGTLASEPTESQLR